MLSNSRDVFKLSFAESELIRRDPDDDNLDDSTCLLDGNQMMEVFWNGSNAVKQAVAKQKYKGELHTTFKPGTVPCIPMFAALTRPGVPNIGIVF